MNGKSNENFFKNHIDTIIPIIITIFIVLLAIILFLITKDSTNEIVNNGEEKIKAITEKGIIKSEEYQGLEFSNITLIKENDIYTLTADVKNTSKEVNKTMMVDIPIKDKKGNVIITLLGYIGKELAPGETVTISASTGADLSNAYTKEIAEKK